MSVIKWPGGKANEFQFIKHLVPKFDRYIEPFFGGGAIFFALKPQVSLINDISNDLINFYKLVFSRDEEFIRILKSYSTLWITLLDFLDGHHDTLLEISSSFSEASIVNFYDSKIVKLFKNTEISFDTKKFRVIVIENAYKKLHRIVYNQHKNNQVLSQEDLLENIKTGFLSGIYMYFRYKYNEYLSNKTINKDRAAIFYLVRELCYGSMFRYNKKGEFNIPYGGMSYNRKNIYKKFTNFLIENENLLNSKIEIGNKDFEEFLNQYTLNENDFIFLDPPYDTDFSDYEGKDFLKSDQLRLANSLINTKAKFILIIKKTEYIESLYKNKKGIYIDNFEKKYTYNVRGRNNRDVEHLIIFNYS